MPPRFDPRTGAVFEPRRSGRPKARPGNGWVTTLAAIAIGLGAVSYAFLDGRDRVLVASLCGCMVCLMAYVTVERIVHRSVALRLFIASYALQFVALASIAGLNLPFTPPYHPFQIDASDAPLLSVLAILTAPVGALLAALLWNFITRLSGRKEKPTGREEIAKRRRIYLVMAALVHLLYWPAGLEGSGVLGYVGRILATGLVCAPFLAGQDSLEDRALGGLWLFTILVNAAVGIAAGTRSKALIAAVLFFAGYISAIPKRKRVIASAVAAVLAVPLIQLAGALGVVRNELGRGVELVEVGRISEVFQQLSREMLPSESQNSQAVRENGVSRMLAWTNVVVPLMTPDVVPYRGFEGFLDEAAQTFRVATVSGVTADDLYEAGLWNAPARAYGFSVNSNTAVEFTLAADGWSRGGAPVALLFSFAAGLVLMMSEAAAFRLHKFGTGAATIIALPIAKAAFFDTSVVPLLPMLRGVALYTVIVGVIVVLVESSRQTIRVPRRGATLRTTTWSRTRG